jgi:hypothetical protein
MEIFKMSKELVVPETEYAIMKPESNIREIIANNLGGEQISITDLNRVKVPGAGGTTWSIPTIDGEAESKAIEGIIVSTSLTRSYWKEAYGKGGGNTPPDCYSLDAIKGIGDPGGSCMGCPNDEWGTSENGHGKACKMRRLIFTVQANHRLPTVISVPTGSLKNAKKYLMDLSNLDLNKYDVITRFTLEKRKNDDGIEYSQIVFTRVSTIAPEQRPTVKAYVDAITPYIQQAAQSIASEADTFVDDVE